MTGSGPSLWLPAIVSLLLVGVGILPASEGVEDILVRAERAVETGDPGEALRLFEKVEREGGGPTPATRLGIAAACHALGRYEQAAEAARAAFELSDLTRAERAIAFGILGMSLVEVGSQEDLPLAERALGKAASETGGKWFDVRLAHVVALARLGRSEEARATAEDLFEDEDTPLATCDAARILFCQLVPERDPETSELPHVPNLPEGKDSLRKIHSVQITYPSEARSRGIRGLLVMDTLVDEHGCVVTTRRWRGPEVLEPAAKTAILQWVYRREDPDPAPGWIVNKVDFRLH